MRGRGIYRCEFSQASGMRMLKVEEFKKLGVAKVVEEARHIVGDGPVYLTIDTDVFDCSVMPGTTLPEPFGLSGEEAIRKAPSRLILGNRNNERSVFLEGDRSFFGPSLDCMEYLDPQTDNRIAFTSGNAHHGELSQHLVLRPV